MVKAQLSLEALVILTILAIYLSAVIGLWSQVFNSLEDASASMAMNNLKDELEFYEKLYSNSPGQSTIKYSTFPTIHLSLWKDGSNLTITASSERDSAFSKSLSFPFTGQLDAPIDLNANGKLLISNSTVLRLSR